MGMMLSDHLALVVLIMRRKRMREKFLHVDETQYRKAHLVARLGAHGQDYYKSLGLAQFPADPGRTTQQQTQRMGTACGT